MLRKSNEMKTDTKPNFKGADGSVDFLEIATKEETLGKARLFSKLTVNAKSGIGVHTHNNEAEIFYVLSGTATYFDDDKAYEITVGDMVECFPQHSHGIKNDSDEPFEILALIVLE